MWVISIRKCIQGTGHGLVDKAPATQEAGAEFGVQIPSNHIKSWAVVVTYS